MKNPNRFIYCLDERVLTDILPVTEVTCIEDKIYSNFIGFGDLGLTLAHPESNIIGVGHNYLGEFKHYAPIVPYGILVRCVKKTLHTDTIDMHVSNIFSNVEIEFGLYKQTKTDGSQVLSLGISSEITTLDVSPYSEVEELGNLNRELPKINLIKSIISSGMWVVPTFDLPVKLDDIIPLGLMRTGVKKPGYEGAAHVCAPYAIVVDKEKEVIFAKEGHEFMGWYTPNELSALFSSQLIFKELEEEGCTKEKKVFTNKGSRGVNHLLDIPTEPWTIALFATQGIVNYFKEIFLPKVGVK